MGYKFLVPRLYDSNGRYREMVGGSVSEDVYECYMVLECLATCHVT